MTVEELLQAIHGVLKRGALTVCQRVVGVSRHDRQAEWQITLALLITEAGVKCEESLQVCQKTLLTFLPLKILELRPLRGHRRDHLTDLSYPSHDSARSQNHPVLCPVLFSYPFSNSKLDRTKQRINIAKQYTQSQYHPVTHKHNDTQHAIHDSTHYTENTQYTENTHCTEK